MHATVSMLLCVGGRLSLIKAVLGNLPTYYMSLYKMHVAVYNKLESMQNQFFIGGDQGAKKMAWMRWNSCMDSKQKGGPGIGSIHALNVGLLFKWLWRFLSQSSDLWISIIKEIHGFHGGIFDPSSYSSCLSPWSGILSSIKSLKKKGTDLLSLCSCKLGNGDSIRFWDDVWPPRGGIESSQLSDLKLLVGSVVLSEHTDSWLWSLSYTLDVGPLATRWNKNVPTKVNVFLWRLLCVGGHLSLIKAVLGNLPTYYMSLYKMHVAVYNKLESMQNQFFIGGDQGAKKMAWMRWNSCIGSIHALNVGLLFKWLWRFLSQSSDLWISIIKEIHGFHGGIFDPSSYSSYLSPWSGILSSIKSLKKKGIDLLSLCSCKLGNGDSIRFWDDVWCDSQPLKVQFPRVYMLDNDKSCCVANRLGLHDWSSVFRRPPRGDSWLWSLDISKGFSVARFRLELDVVSDETAHVVTVMFDDIVKELVKYVVEDSDTKASNSVDEEPIEDKDGGTPD
uniref:RNA-directed DNA polymerase, eukaryota, reverse transcriptase zinc-binding domain protein n=1 Tax=Tanacetum cinerariifolium TaxID=118510 RepID=A0A6L2JCH6_TANCI|nr:RNA-directed DNA polymerase, eukaryota, reverse transcriptase zinc-binding domain protein [Tanacetum cinerariifolium]